MLHNRIYERLSFNNFKKIKRNNNFLQNVFSPKPVSTNKIFQEIKDLKLSHNNIITDRKQN